MKIINDQCLWLQHQADVLGVVTLRMAGCCAGSRRPESPGGPPPPTHALESSLHSSALSEGHFETAFLKSEWGLAAAAPLSTQLATFRRPAPCWTPCTSGLSHPPAVPAPSLPSRRGGCPRGPARAFLTVLTPLPGSALSAMETPLPSSSAPCCRTTPWRYVEPSTWGPPA